MVAEHEIERIFDVPDLPGVFAFDPKGKFLAFGASERGTAERIKVWYLDTGRLVAEAKFHTKADGRGIRTISWHPSRQVLLTSSSSPINTLRMWSLGAEGRIAGECRTLDEYRRDIADALFDPKGEWVLSCSTSHEESIRLYEFDTECFFGPGAGTGKTTQVHDSRLDRGGSDSTGFEAIASPYKGDLVSVVRRMKDGSTQIEIRRRSHLGKLFYSSPCLGNGQAWLLAESALLFFGGDGRLRLWREETGATSIVLEDDFPGTPQSITLNAGCTRALLTFREQTGTETAWHHVTIATPYPKLQRPARVLATSTFAEEPRAMGWRDLFPESEALVATSGGVFALSYEEPRPSPFRTAARLATESNLGGRSS